MKKKKNTEKTTPVNDKAAPNATTKRLSYSVPGTTRATKPGRNGKPKNSISPRLLFTAVLQWNRVAVSTHHHCTIFQWYECVCVSVCISFISSAGAGGSLPSTAQP